MKKKIRAAALFLSFAVLLSPFVACGAGGTEDRESLLPPDFLTEGSTGGEPPEEETASPTETPAETPTDSPTENSTETTAEATKETPAPAPIVKKTALYIRCTSESVNLRSGAGTGYSVVGQAEKGTVYAVNKLSDGWYQVPYKNGTAYLYSGYAKELEIEKSDNKKVEAVLAQGYTALGVPYVYGAVRLHDGSGKLLKGFTKNKFDCSSLVQYAFYYGAGVLLNTTTRTQVKQGKYVAPSELVRGDCIFFTNASRQTLTGIERIGHVAIYLGDNYILHTSSDYARIEQISDARWSFYIEARRFV